MVRSLLAVLAALVMGTFTSAVLSAPISVRIDDHDFTFDVPYLAAAGWGAVYDYQGVGPDRLYVLPPDVADPDHYVASYSYVGKLSTVPPSALGAPPAASAFLYPVANSNTFGGDLQLNMTFDTNDGPYVSGSDRFDISLVGLHPESDFLRIRGQIFSQGPMTALSALYPIAPAGNDITLLDIQLEKVTLLARVGEDRLFLVEGQGKIRTLLGQDVSQVPGLPEVGVTFLKFFAEAPQTAIFTSPTYQPADAPVDLPARIKGHVSGEAGAAVPEPATLGLMGMGVAAMLFGRRRK